MNRSAALPSFLPLAALAALLALPGCCENQYALRAARNELRACETRMAELETEAGLLHQALATESVERLYRRSNALRDGVRACRMTLYWSKNIGLVAENPTIVRSVRRNRKRLAALEKRNERLMAEMARMRPGLAPPPPADEPPPEEGEEGAPAIPDGPDGPGEAGADGAPDDAGGEAPSAEPEPVYPPPPRQID